jgi:hypothetical protein
MVLHSAGKLPHLHDCSRVVTKVKVDCTGTDSTGVYRAQVKELQLCKLHNATYDANVCDFDRHVQKCITTNKMGDPDTPG